MTKPHIHVSFLPFKEKLKRSNFYFIKIAAQGKFCVGIIGNFVKWFKYMNTIQDQHYKKKEMPKGKINGNYDNFWYPMKRTTKVHLPLTRTS